MTESEFWKKYNRCPFCREYGYPAFQHFCYLCKWHLNRDETKMDLFYPKPEFENEYFKMKNESPV